MQIRDEPLTYSDVTARALTVETERDWRLLFWQRAQYVPFWDVGGVWVTSAWLETTGDASGENNFEVIHDEELLETVRRWETARLANRFPEQVRASMQPFDREFTLLYLKGKWQPYRQQEIANVAGRSDVMAFLVDADGRQLVSLWHTWGEGTLRTTLPARAMDEKERPVELKDGVPLGRRLLLDFGQLPKDQIIKAMQSAQVEVGGGESFAFIAMKAKEW